ncbi:hypothetical protein BIV57_03415 [Mangrovactinospora gilvigrisea]|uniref:DUF4245 domain-containing protein n=1 Tax=Mangrovactinospora gilvigrisea TaxID=1428644 RepID=A0A1J7BJW9_9ACTN|nr:hypothetical protein BIV57_03415 [Mangrovactinospora gilvigrisea]
MRKQFRVRDMVLSMAVMGLVVAVWFFAVPRSSNNGGPPAVTYQDAVSSARRAAPYPLMAPAATPAGWKATSVSYSAKGTDAGDGGDGGDGGDTAFAPTWHLGFYLSGSREYAAVEQGGGNAAKFAKSRTQGGRAGGSVDVSGVSWTKWTGGKHGYRGLVRAVPHGTTAVVGTASWSDLEKLATALKE